MIRRRVGYGLWLFIVIVLYFFENNTGTRIILAASVLIPALSVLCSFHCARHLSCRIEGPGQITGKERAVCTITVCAGRVIRGCNVVLQTQAHNPLAGLSREEEVFARGFPPVLSLPVPGEHCGSVCIRVRNVLCRDWFGLCRFPARMEKEPVHRLLVFPASLQDQAFFVETPSHNKEEEELQAEGRKGPEGGIRPYVPGDPVRQIHWKLSAKTGQILVREGDTSGKQGPVLLLETSLEDWDPDGMDHCVEALFSVSAALVREHVFHKVYWYDHGKEELREMPLYQPSDEPILQEEILKSTSALHGPSIRTLFQHLCPEADELQTFLFAPGADPVPAGDEGWG